MPASSPTGRSMSSTGVASELSLRFKREAGQVVVQVGGELDCASTQLLLERLLDVIEAQGNLVIALDLSGVRFIDSSGLHAVVSIHGLLQARGGTLVLRRPPLTVRRLLEITGMTDVLTVAHA